MFCTNCGTEIDDDSKFCTKCGKRISDVKTIQIENDDRTEVERQIATSKIQKVINEKYRSFKGLPLKKRFFILGVSTFVLLCVIVVKLFTRDPIIGKWEECDYIYVYQGISSYETNPLYLVDREPDRLEFFKDGSFAYSDKWTEDTGTWENTTKKADKNPVYILSDDKESGRLHIKDKRLYLKINNNEYRVFKKQ